MKRYYFVIIAFCLFFLPGVVEAKCNYADKVRLQKLAGNVLFSYDYHENDYAVTFDVTVSNLTPDLYMVDVSTGKTYRFNNQDIVISGYRSGATIQFNFYAVDAECANEKEAVFTNYVTLPNFNPFYREQICEGINDYKLCQKWMKMDISYTEFYKLVYQYKQKQSSSVIEEEEVEEEVSLGEQFFYFWEKYYIYILGIVLIGCLLGFYLYNRSLKM